MEYKIGEVSKILNISKEMIRYYDKQGIFINGNYSLSINSFWNQRYL